MINIEQLIENVKEDVSKPTHVIYLINDTFFDINLQNIENEEYLKCIKRIAGICLKVLYETNSSGN